MKEFDTICAIATALGEGGIAIIRISGDKALDIASKIFRPKSNDDIKNMKPYTMKYGHIYDIETNDLIDEVIISFMKGPRSFTAEAFCLELLSSVAILRAVFSPSPAERKSSKV